LPDYPQFSATSVINMPIMKISQRKAEHIRISLKESIQFRQKHTGFEEYDFIHCALPELNWEDIDTQIQVFNKRLSMPLMISAMTGGYDGALEINRKLAETCQATGIGLGVGSQRQIMESRDFIRSYTVVRQAAPDILIFGNIGISQLLNMDRFEPVTEMAALIGADAMAVHLNPLQEILQPDGDIQFRGAADCLKALADEMDIPVIVKETGCGISEAVAHKLFEAGIRWIDVAGAGGTSWSAVEAHRCRDKQTAAVFSEWGIPTANSIEMVSRVPGISIIASGGIRDGLTIAKALALGAELCGAAWPFLKVLFENGEEGVTRLVQQWKKELEIVLLLTGCRDIRELRQKGILRKV